MPGISRYAESLVKIGVDGIFVQDCVICFSLINCFLSNCNVHNLSGSQEISEKSKSKKRQQVDGDTLHTRGMYKNSRQSEVDIDEETCNTEFDEKVQRAIDDESEHELCPGEPMVQWCEFSKLTSTLLIR